MRDAGDGARFVAEPLDAADPPRSRLVREDLDGHGPIESRVSRTVDFAHSAVRAVPGSRRTEASSSGDLMMDSTGSIAIPFSYGASTLTLACRAVSSRLARRPAKEGALRAGSSQVVRNWDESVVSRPDCG